MGLYSLFAKAVATIRCRHGSSTKDCNLPWGYKRVSRGPFGIRGTKIGLDPHEARIVRHSFKRYTEGATLETIASEINDVISKIPR